MQFVDIPSRATNNSFRAEGFVKNFNTIEEFTRANRAELAESVTKRIWDAIQDGSVYENPSLLVPFIILCFADLKKYKFTTLFGFPTFGSTPAWTLDGDLERFDEAGATLDEAVRKWRESIDWKQHGFFLAKKTSSGWVVGSLSEYETGFFENVNVEDITVGFADAAGLQDNPGWIGRSVLALVHRKWGLSNVRLLAYRATASQSIILPVTLQTVDASESLAKLSLTDSAPKTVPGWEKTPENKFATKVVNLGATMDPSQLAANSVDLNLKLMRWRVAPSLDLEGIKTSKCLLLGAGTLGSYVARILLGWGVRHITFIDNGVVSYSNPVRQPLFTFEDCVGGKTAKAPAAAEALKAIFPGVTTEGIEMSVPMAGHPIANEAAVRADTERLEALIDSHDAIFLLMDTRESRWLPTLLGKAKGKIILTSALGFDSFVVMRHGTTSISDDKNALGCYFCNDVVAPADSLTDRTLDQQCTVTRPGIAPLASSLVVEMLVSLLQHPLKDKAPAAQRGDDTSITPLGVVPHQLRGHLSSWDTVMVKGQAFDKCSACSDNILDGYRKGGWEFLKRALGEDGFVEEVSGLAELKRQAEEAKWDDEDEGSDGWGDEPEIL